jgi:hypothetical protein
MMFFPIYGFSHIYACAAPIPQENQTIQRFFLGSNIQGDQVSLFLKKSPKMLPNTFWSKPINKLYRKLLGYFCI